MGALYSSPELLACFLIAASSIEVVVILRATRSGPNKLLLAYHVLEVRNASKTLYELLI